MHGRRLSKFRNDIIRNPSKKRASWGWWESAFGPIEYGCLIFHALKYLGFRKFRLALFRFLVTNMRGDTSRPLELLLPEMFHGLKL